MKSRWFGGRVETSEFSWAEERKFKLTSVSFAKMALPSNILLAALANTAVVVLELESCPANTTIVTGKGYAGDHNKISTVTVSRCERATNEKNPASECVGFSFPLSSHPLYTALYLDSCTFPRCRRKKEPFCLLIVRLLTFPMSSSSFTNQSIHPPRPPPSCCSWEDCCSSCVATPKCNAWSYHPAGGHSPLQCTLLTEAAPPHSSDGTISGNFRKGPIPPSPPSPSPSPSPAPRPRPTPPPVGPVHPPLGYQPNIIFIQTDDQDVELGGLVPMPKLRKLVGEKGCAILFHLLRFLVNPRMLLRVITIMHARQRRR